MDSSRPFEIKVRDFLLKGLWFEKGTLLLAGVGIWASLYLVFMVVPNERVMGAVQRIFYFHVGSAMSCYFQIAALFVGSVLYLNSKSVVWDIFAEAAGAVALTFCTIVLFSGMIWGQAAWGTWWRWEPRLVSFLVLWLILVGYVLLRSVLKEDERIRSFASVVGILAAINVPIVIFSIRLLSPQEQLHPEVVANQGLKDARYIIALVLTNFTVIFMSVLLFLQHVRMGLLSEELLNLERKVN